ncbi:MAG: GNAT family N-acetyltransferase [Chloroflexota bacterium]
MTIQTDSFTFRFINSTDDLIHAFNVVGSQFDPPLTHDDRRFIDVHNGFPDDQTLMIVALQDETIVGGVFAFRKGSNVVARMLALDASVRGKGVGRRLMEILEIQAMRLGARQISLGAVPDARTFYPKLGYYGKSSMHKELPMPGRVLDLKLKRWTARLGDLAAGAIVQVDPESRQIPPLL